MFFCNVGFFLLQSTACCEVLWPRIPRCYKKRKSFHGQLFYISFILQLFISDTYFIPLNLGSAKQYTDNVPCAEQLELPLRSWLRWKWGSWSYNIKCSYYKHPINPSIIPISFATRKEISFKSLLFWVYIMSDYRHATFKSTIQHAYMLCTLRLRALQSSINERTHCSLCLNSLWQIHSLCQLELVYVKKTFTCKDLQPTRGM